MVRFYYYKNPKTGKIFSDQRMQGYENKPYIDKDGIECELLVDYRPSEEERTSGIAIINKNREVFQADSDYVKKCKPKYVKFQDGHRERYDSSKHC